MSLSLRRTRKARLCHTGKDASVYRMRQVSGLSGNVSVTNFRRRVKAAIEIVGAIIACASNLIPVRLEKKKKNYPTIFELLCMINLLYISPV